MQAEDLGRGGEKVSVGETRGPVATGPQPYLGVHQRCEREVVKQVGEVLPHVGVAVLAEALIVEAVHLRDLPTLVVPSQDGDALAVADLQKRDASAEFSFACVYPSHSSPCQ